MSEAERLAKEHATCKPDCTCKGARHWPERETSFLAGYSAAEKKAAHRTEALVRALEKIANEDFRGNRPWSATIAYKALREYRGEG